MQRYMFPLITGGAAVFLAAAPATAQRDIGGTYFLNRQESSDANAAIDAAVSRSNFVIRTQLRARLRQAAAMPSVITIREGAQRLRVIFSGMPTPPPAPGSDQLERRLERGVMGQHYSIVPDPSGTRLTINVTLTDLRAAAPVILRFVYDKAT